MLANATSLWIAATLSVSAVVSARTIAGHGSGLAGSRIDPEASPPAAAAKICMGGYADPCRTTGASRERVSPSPMSPSNGSESVSAPVRDLGASGRAVYPIPQYSRSLSYLSLTLRCMAPHSGWLGGCAPLPKGSGRCRPIPVTGWSDPTRESESRTDDTCVFTGGQTEPQRATRSTRRIRPVFL
jgi:hypothetical protein